MPITEEAEQHSVDCLLEAEKQRQAGNQYYQSKDYRAAIRCYHNAILQVKAVQQIPQTSGLLSALAAGGGNGDTPTSSHSDNVDEEEDTENADGGPGSVKRSRTEERKLEADDIMIKCYNNLAACIIHGENRRREDYLRAVDYCEKVLEKDSGNEKALFRKGIALQKGQLYEKAVQAFDKCHDNSEAQRQVQICRKLMAEDRRKRDEEIRMNFERARLRQEAREQHQNAMAAGDGAVAEGGVAEAAAGAGFENGAMPNGELPPCASSNGHHHADE